MYHSFQNMFTSLFTTRKVAQQPVNKVDKSKNRPNDKTKKVVATPKSEKQKKGLKLSSDLSGSRFRWLNDLLYSQKGSSSLEAFSKDPSLFEQYHAGFAAQAQQWPTNPVDECLVWLRKNERIKKIGDFGCGEAAIATALLSEGRAVHSFDLVDGGNTNITPCNISKVPIKDSYLDAAVFNLSLMGVDWPSFIVEARRCLRKGGLLYISEVVSRMPDPELFAKGLDNAGFDVIRHRPSEGNFFHTFVARKSDQSGEPSLMDSSLLGKCHYKKR